MSSLTGSISPGGGSFGQGALQAQSGLANALSGVGAPALSKASGYFSTLAGGNRAQITQAVAPDVQNINSVYGGTARTLSRFLRGPTKDVAMADAERQRAGQIGNLFSGVRPQANTALAGIGESAVSGASGIFGSQAQLAQQAEEQSAQNTTAAGTGFGGLLFNLLKTFVKQPATG